ncbi:hypothetical protein BKA80DRAFT_308924 [Phyllosticta citrichinensis]
MFTNLFSNIQNVMQRLNRPVEQALQEALNQAAEARRAQHLLERSSSSSSSQQRGASSSSPSFTPRVRDVHVAKQLLMRPPCNLPLELVVLVLDYAEYWPVLARAERADRVRLDADFLPGNCIAGLYLASPALPLADVERGERAKPREVRVWVKSRDQGWVSQDRRGLDPYAQSYSWFDACIFRPTSPSISSSTSTTIALPHFDRVAKPVDAAGALAAASMSFVPRTVVKQRQNEQAGLLEDVHETEEVGLWRLQCNRVAEPRPWQHRIVWREGDEGDAHGFVEALKEGDRVGVWARAMFPRWANQVEAMAIEVCGSVI